MKKLLFLGIVVLMVESLGAVTLPSTSYSPYASGGSSESSEIVFSSGSMVKGSYSSLGAYPPVDVCTSEDPDVPIEEDTCENCCKKYFNCTPTDVECLNLRLQCTNSCEHGPSLPLDGGLSILLLLSLAGGAVKLLRNIRVNS